MWTLVTACQVLQRGTEQQRLERHINRWMDWMSEGEKEVERRNGWKRLATVSERSGCHEGEIKEGKEAWMKGRTENWECEVKSDGKREGRKLSFTLQSLWQFAETAREGAEGEKREREERKGKIGRGRRERKGGSASADYLSTSVINVETRILLGL